MQFRNAPLSGVLAGPARQDLRHLSPPHTPQGAAGLPGGAELARPVLLLQVLCVCQQSDGRQDVPQTGQAALQLRVCEDTDSQHTGHLCHHCLTRQLLQIWKMAIIENIILDDVEFSILPIRNEFSILQVTVNLFSLGIYILHFLLLVNVKQLRVKFNDWAKFLSLDKMITCQQQFLDPSSILNP